MPDTQNIIYVAAEGVIEFSSAISQTKMKLLKRKMDTGAHIVGFAMSSLIIFEHFHHFGVKTLKLWM